LSNIVVDVLSVLQIGHIQTSIVGSVEERGISGGQRKRVNIGLELAATPTLLFLDEPTSGLDSTSSLAIIKSLKKLTELGMTIIMVIHQPRFSIFTLFDTVLLLAKGGRTAYLGPSVNAMEYFTSVGFAAPENDNPADWLMDVISGDVKNHAESNASLPDLWIANSAVPTALEGKEIKSLSNNRQWSFTDDRTVVQWAIEEEWDKIDRDQSGFLDKKELRLLLKMLSGKMPRDEAFEDLCENLFPMWWHGQLSGEQGTICAVHRNSCSEQFRMHTARTAAFWG
jgi:ABC-type multidrug transport system ATPase subunit